MPRWLCQSQLLLRGTSLWLQCDLSYCECYSRRYHIRWSSNNYSLLFLSRLIKQHSSIRSRVKSPTKSVCVHTGFKSHNILVVFFSSHVTLHVIFPLQICLPARWSWTWTYQSFSVLARFRPHDDWSHIRHAARYLTISDLWRPRARIIKYYNT